MTRSPEQNEKFHCWCRIIAKHLQANGAKVSEAMVKELAKAEFMPVEITIGTKTRVVGKPTKKCTVDEMNTLMSEMQAWSATDLNLELE